MGGENEAQPQQDGGGGGTKIKFNTGGRRKSDERYDFRIC